jgi:lipopolysaccharide/colanic/teichoic acid biosynthesis glycosyltransferase
MNKGLRYLICSADFAWIGVAFMLANLFRHGLNGLSLEIVPFLRMYAPLIAISLIFWTMLFFNKKLEGFTHGWHFPTVVSNLIVASAYLVVGVLAFGFLLKLDCSRLALLLFAILLPVGLVIIRCVAWSIVRSRSRSSGAIRRVAIIGDGRLARELAYKITKHPELMIEVVGFLSPAGNSFRHQSKPLKSSSGSIRTLDALNLLRESNVREIIIAEQLPSNTEVEKLHEACQRLGMQIRFVPHWFELYLSKARLTEIDDVPLVSLEPRNLPIGARSLKRAVEFVLGSILLILSLPLMGLIWAVLRKRKGTAIKRELRCGLHANHFWLYRFNIDRWSPDLTGLEKLLAQYSLTELPQVWNVIRGEMALVGPRPESPDRVKHYSIWQRQRLSVKPGLTGLAQVNGLREHHSSAEKAQFDLQYIYHYSMFFDVSIVLQTVWTLCYRLIEERFPRVSVFARPAARPLVLTQEALHVDSSQSGSD